MFIVLYTKINISKTYKKVICAPKLSKATLSATLSKND